MSTQSSHELSRQRRGALCLAYGSIEPDRPGLVHADGAGVGQRSSVAGGVGGGGWVELFGGVGLRTAVKAAKIIDIELPPDFKEFLKLLSENGIEYLDQEFGKRTSFYRISPVMRSNGQEDNSPVLLAFTKAKLAFRYATAFFADYKNDSEIAIYTCATATTQVKFPACITQELSVRIGVGK